MTGCLNVYIWTPNYFWSDPRYSLGLNLNHLDEREGLVALCCRRERFTGQRRERKKQNFLSSAKTFWNIVNKTQE